jgi:hypothetical protein
VHFLELIKISFLWELTSESHFRSNRNAFYGLFVQVKVDITMSNIIKCKRVTSVRQNELPLRLDKEESFAK